MPNKQYADRMRKANKTAAKKGRTVGKNYQARAGLNIYVTNTKIEAKQVRLLYSIRWQIELIFKIWK